MTDLALTAAAMADRIEAYTGNTSAGNALMYLNAGYRRFISGLDPRTRQSHHWSFLRPLGEINIGGSANALGVQSGAYAFASGSIFNRSMVGLTMTVVNYNGSENLAVNIAQYSSATCVKMDSSAAWTYGSATVSVESNGIADLPAGFGGFVQPPTYIFSEDATEGTPPLEEVSPDSIYAAWRDNDDTDDPQFYAWIAKTFTAATGQRYEMLVAPRPEEQRTFLYRYLVNPDVLTDAAVYPVGGSPMSEAIKYAGLAAAEQEAGRVDNGPMERRYQELLQAAIDYDVDLLMSHDNERIENPGLG